MNPMSLTVDDLAAERFFTDFDRDDIAVLAPHARLRDYPADATIFRAGGPADTFYLLRTGRVALYLPTLQRDLIVQTVGRGDALGFSWLTPPHLWRFTATAKTEVELIEFDAKALRQAAIADAHLHDLLVTRMLAVVARRLEATRMQLLDFYSDPRDE